MKRPVQRKRGGPDLDSWAIPQLVGARFRDLDPGNQLRVWRLTDRKILRTVNGIVEREPQAEGETK